MNRRNAQTTQYSAPHRSHAGFSSLAAVSQLFDNLWMLLAGWMHYLAVDLFAGAWILRDARAQGVAHVWVLPLLLLSFLLGQQGWLSYLVVREVVRRRTSARGDERAGCAALWRA